MRFPSERMIKHPNWKNVKNQGLKWTSSLVHLSLAFTLGRGADGDDGLARPPHRLPLRTRAAAPGTAAPAPLGLGRAFQVPPWCCVRTTQEASAGGGGCDSPPVFPRTPLSLKHFPKPVLEPISLTRKARLHFGADCWIKRAVAQARGLLSVVPKGTSTDLSVSARNTIAFSSCSMPYDV